jgi:flagellin-specific chaperone FliS
MKQIRKTNRGTVQQTNDKWIKFLCCLKDELENNDIIYFQKQLASKYNIPTDFQRFLREEKFIFKNSEGIYKYIYHKQIHASILNKYRKWRKNDRNNKNKKQLETQPKLQFDMPQTPLPKPPKIRTTKVKVQEPINTPIQQKEYGVIRKFLKWLW